MSEYLKIPAILLFSMACMPLVWPAARNFEYEYALVTSWAFVFLLPLFGLLTPKKLPDKFSGREFLGLVGLPFLALIPGALALGSGACACGGMGYLFWMILLVVPAGWLGLAGMYLVARYPDKKSIRLSIAFTPGVLAIICALTLWFFPQKRALSAVLGFLHGPIYDRWIPVDFGVVLARAGHGLIGIALLGLGIGYFAARGRGFISILTLGFTARLLALGYDTAGHGEWFLDRAMPEVIHAEQIDLHYLRRTPKDQDLAERLARDAAFHAKEIISVLGAEISRPVTIYAYSGSEQKKLLFGGGNTDVTDVWIPTIHISLEASPHPTLRHELVHAVASYVSWHGIGFHPNMLITEGLAMALAPVDSSLDYDDVSASMLKTGRVTSLESLFTPLGFWSESGARSYMIAGSFLRWLMTNYGGTAVRDLYMGQSLAAVTHDDPASVMAKWSMSISAGYQEKNNLIVEHYTRESGVFEEICPHTMQDLERPRSSGLLTRLRQPIGWDQTNWNAWRVALNPKDRDAMLDKFRVDVVAVFKQNPFDATAASVWREAVEKGRAWPPRVIEDIEMAVIHSDIESVLGNKDAAKNILLELMELFAAKNPGSALKRQVEARLALDLVTDESQAKLWRRYVAGWGTLPAPAAGEPWILGYLRSRRAVSSRMENLNAWRGKISEAKTYPEIQKEWIKMLANAYADNGAFTEAGELYADLTPLLTGEAKRLAAENSRRMTAAK